ncbi:hypothetical protein FHL15_000440 [Xylaria flabelliformis]|uniref:Uncharacterized protein n=1 Tax=Xylaria flabelliformis TaxID=2512241 RepID=A0A553IFY3_9PEZI|nr:hypothetical protein FHL15_000440 [Xylaria flabelliformis]
MVPGSDITSKYAKRFGTFKDTRQNLSLPLRYQPQSRSSHSSRHTDATQKQQRRESVVNIEIHPSTKRYYSTSNKATMSPRPSQDSGYVSRDPCRYFSGTSNTSTRRRSSSRPNPRKQSQYDGGDRSIPPIALDRAEKRISMAKTRIENTRRGAQRSGLFKPNLRVILTVDVTSIVAIHHPTCYLHHSRVHCRT